MTPILLEYLNSLDDYPDFIANTLLKMLTEEYNGVLANLVSSYCKSINININEESMNEKFNEEIRLAIMNDRHNVSNNINHLKNKMKNPENDPMNLLKQWGNYRVHIKESLLNYKPSYILCMRYIEGKLLSQDIKNNQLNNISIILSEFFQKSSMEIEPRFMEFFQKDEENYNMAMNGFNNDISGNDKSNVKAKTYVKSNGHNLLSDE